MVVRLTAVLLLATVVMSACSSGTGVPEDQAVRPGEVPAGWAVTRFGDLTIAAPPAWTKSETKKATETMDTTTWRADSSGGSSPSGVEVREISRPQQNAEKNALALAISAMATMQGGKVEPTAIAWPKAEAAYYLSYDATFGPPGQTLTYVARTMVFDLKNGHQVQVTAIAAKGTDVRLPESVLSTVELS